MKRIRYISAKRTAATGLALLCVVMLATGGCENQPKVKKPPQATHPAEKVKLNDLADKNGSTKRDDLSTSPCVVVQKLVLRCPSPRLTLAMTGLAPPPFDPTVLELWKRNGFGIGRIDRNRLALLMANLPKPISVNVYTIHKADLYAPIPLVKQAPGRYQVKSFQANGRRRIEQFVGGEDQMLIKLLPPQPNDIAPLRVNLMPHHFTPKRALVPRSQQQRTLNGISFTDLRLVEPLDVDHVWAIWFGATDITLEGNASARPPAEPPPLGETMMTGRRGRNNVQLLLLIAIEKQDATTSP